MIVVDESIHSHEILDEIAIWYSGRVTRLVSLRPATLINDDNVPTLLRQIDQPTFITINVDDFWRRIRADRSYCVVALELTQGKAHQISDLLRRVLRLPAFHTKAARMGKVIRVMPTYIEYYAADRQIYTMPWGE